MESVKPAAEHHLILHIAGTPNDSFCLFALFFVRACLLALSERLVSKHRCVSHGALLGCGTPAWYLNHSVELSFFFLPFFYMKGKCKLSHVQMCGNGLRMATIWCHKEFFFKKMADLVCVVRVSAHHFGGINTACDSLYKFARFNGGYYGARERSHTVIKQACCHEDVHTTSLCVSVCRYEHVRYSSCFVTPISHNTHTFTRLSFFLMFLWSLACYYPVHSSCSLTSLPTDSVAPPSPRWPMTLSGHFHFWVKSILRVCNGKSKVYLLSWVAELCCRPLSQHHPVRPVCASVKPRDDSRSLHFSAKSFFGSWLCVSLNTSASIQRCRVLDVPVITRWPASLAPLD